eukprot:19335-Heterococcus_DN1.PRE.3
MLANWQAKWYGDFYSHTGQLCAGMRVTREQYCRDVLGKRKRDDVDPLLAKVVTTYAANIYVKNAKSAKLLNANAVPHIGILTSGSLWTFVRYNEDTKQFIRSGLYTLPLTAISTTFELSTALHRIVARMVQLLREHVNDVNAMLAARSRVSSSTTHSNSSTSTQVQQFNFKTSTCILNYSVLVPD